MNSVLLQCQEEEGIKEEEGQKDKAEEEVPEVVATPAAEKDVRTPSPERAPKSPETKDKKLTTSPSKSEKSEVSIRSDSTKSGSIHSNNKAKEEATPPWDANDAAPDVKVRAWRESKRACFLSPQHMRQVVRALLDLNSAGKLPAAGASLWVEVAEYLALHSSLDIAEGNSLSEATVAVIDVAAQTQDVAVLESAEDALRAALDLDSNAYERLIAGYAALDKLDQSNRVLEQALSSACDVNPVYLHAQLMRGLVRAQHLTKALDQLSNIQQAITKARDAKEEISYDHASLSEPLVELTYLAVSDGVSMTNTLVTKVDDSTDNTAPTIVLPVDAFLAIGEFCAKNKNGNLARATNSYRRKCEVVPKLSYGAYDALLRSLVHGQQDTQAIELYEEMLETHKPTDSTLVGLLLLCADARFLRLAEKVAQSARDMKLTSLPFYSAWMRVYAYCGLYEKACGLYEQLTADGLEPDATMYGCLMKFAVDCGQSELSQQLFKKAPVVDIQNYMSLIRACGRTHNVTRAVQILRDIQESEVAIDVAAYNCVLDVCVVSGDTGTAHTLFQEMKRDGIIDVITYNTVIKGYCQAGDLDAAMSLLCQMKEERLLPNDVTHNSLINAFVNAGRVEAAWDLVMDMEECGLRADHYTCSIMLKTIKGPSLSKRSAQRALRLVERSGVDLCADEVLLNTVLDVCIRTRDLDALRAALAKFSSQTALRPSVPTYGTLIKAYGLLRNTKMCRQLFKEIEDRDIQINDITFGCMLDALVTNDSLDEAHELLKKWKPKIPSNTVMYSTLLKGCARRRDADIALQIFEEMVADGVRPNAVSFNTAIDACAAAGRMHQAAILLERMRDAGQAPDMVTYATIIKGYAVSGDLERAYSSFEAMNRDGLQADAIVYNTMLDGGVRQGRLPFCHRVLEVMEQNGVKPSNFTLTILVKLYGREHRLDKAFEVVEDLPKKHGFNANCHVLTCLISASLANGRLDRALEVFNKMRNNPVGNAARPDTKTYTSVINGLLRHGKLSVAGEIIQSVYEGDEKDIGIEAHIRDQVLRQLRAKGLQDVLRPLEETLRKAKVPMDGMQQNNWGNYRSNNNWNGNNNNNHHNRQYHNNNNGYNNNHNQQQNRPKTNLLETARTNSIS